MKQNVSCTNGGKTKSHSGHKDADKAASTVAEGAKHAATDKAHRHEEGEGEENAVYN